MCVHDCPDGCFDPDAPSLTPCSPVSSFPPHRPEPDQVDYPTYSPEERANIQAADTPIE